MVSEQGREHQRSNPVNDQRKDEKRIRQEAFINAMLDQYSKVTPFVGVWETLKALNIPRGTFLDWYDDEDFLKLRRRLSKMRLVSYSDTVERAIIGDGEGLNRVAYAQGMLNRLDPDLRERVEHSGNVSNVTVTLPEGIRSGDTGPSPETGQGQGIGENVQPGASSSD